MANSSQTIKMRSTHGNRKTFAALRDGTDGYGNVGVNDGSRIWAPTYWWRYVCEISGTTLGATTLAGATTQEFDLHTAFPSHLFPEGVLIHGCVLRLVTAFSGGAVSACVASVGDTGNADEWIDAQDVFTGASAVPESDTADTDAVSAIAPGVYENAYIPTLTLDTTSANVSALTAGSLEIFFLLSDFPDFD
jgi:hypothetical protein